MAVKKAKKVVATTLGNPVSSLGSYKPPTSVAQPAAPKTFVATPPAAPTPSIDSDPALQTQLAAIIKNRDDALLRLTQQEGTTKREYGIEDTSDPFSRAALLQQSLQRNQTASSNGMAAAGQFFSGALQNAKNANQTNYNQNYDSLSKTYQSALAAIKDARQTATTGAQTDIGTAQGEALSRLLASRPAPDASPDPVVSAVAAKPASAKKGFSFVQSSGSRAGMSYNVIQKGGKNYRRYENGDVVAA